MSKKTMVIVPTWDPDEPRFVVADAPEHISDDRKFVDGRCIENQRLGIVYSVEDIVYALNNSDVDKLTKENEQLKKENIEYKGIINFCTNESDDALVQVIRANVKLQNELDKLKSYEPIDKGVNDE